MSPEAQARAEAEAIYRATRPPLPTPAPPEPLTLEQRVEALERTVAHLLRQPSPYDVIGDQMSPGR